MPKKEENISWGVRKRLQFIEFQLLFNREIKSPVIMAEFGTSRQQSSTDLNLYKELHPDNLLPYDPSTKSHKPSPLFTPQYITENLTTDIEVTFNKIAKNTSIETIPSIERIQLKGVLTRIILAIENDECVEVIYKSSSTPYGKKRTIKPMALAYVGNRTHIRAYCFENTQYRDFVLSRFAIIPRRVDIPIDNLPKDLYWEERIEIKLEANPSLDEDGQLLINNEYNLMNAKPVVTRKALFHYFLMHNNLPTCNEDIELAKRSPWAFPVVVSDWKNVSKYLFNK